MKEDKKKVFIKNFGCQMNVRDSEVICGLFKKEGYKLTDDPKKAAIILFNTCSVREHAEDKVWSEAGRYKGSQASKKIIGLIGCMAQNYKEKIFQRCPQVNFAVGPSNIHKIPLIVKRLSKAQDAAKSRDLIKSRIHETNGSIRPEEIYQNGFYQDKEHAYVVISEGCSNFCSYCIVPHVRGRLHNRKHRDIIKEIKLALERGIKRITLLGQNVNAYRSKGVDFVKLLELVNDFKDLKGFSFLTSHPKDADRRLFQAMQGLERLKKYLHLPVQSGSDRILKLMKRGYSRISYLNLIDSYRKIVKNGVLTTDVIVGFPTETEEDFQQTHNLIRQAEFDAAYIFKYSARPHTQAIQYPDDVSRQEKERRHKIILDLQKDFSRRVKK